MLSLSRAREKKKFTALGIFRVPRKLTFDRRLPYVAAFPIGGTFRVSDDFKPSLYPGLIFVMQVSDVNGKGKLFSYWIDKDYFSVHGESFRTALALSPTDLSGFVSRIEAPKKSIWKEYSWKELLIAAVAVVGSIFTLHGYLASAFDPPDVQISFADSSPIDAVAHTPFHSEMTVINNSVYAPTKIKSIEARAFAAGGGRSIPLHSESPTLPVIPAGQAGQFKIEGVAPEPISKQGAPDAYRLQVEVKARTGFAVWTGSERTQTSRELRVWPVDIGWGQLTPVGTTASAEVALDFLRAIVTIYPGRRYEKGARGYLILTSSSDEDVTIQLQDETEKLPSSPPGNTVTHKAEFHTRPLDKFQPYPVAVMLEAKRQLTQKRWRELIQQIEIYAE